MGKLGSKHTEQHKSNIAESLRKYPRIDGIYKIINIINDIYYLGRAINIYGRFRNHIKDLENNKHKNKHFQHAWNLYGKENFRFEIFEEFIFPKDYSKELKRDYLICREQYYLDNLNLPNHRVTYNLSNNANGGGTLFTEKRRKSFSNYRKNLFKDPIYKEEANRKINEGLMRFFENGGIDKYKLKRWDKIVKREKRVLQMDINRNPIALYSSVIHIEEDLGISHKTINKYSKLEIPYKNNLWKILEHNEVKKYLKFKKD